MNSIIAYFQSLEQRPLERLAIFAGGLMLLWFIESAIPYIHLTYKKNKSRHAAVNIVFTVIHFIIHTLLAIFVVVIADWTQKHHFGLTRWLNTGVFMTILLSAMVMDFFAGWTSHLIEHRIPLFWRFHIIHHADNNVDVTTGLRHHPMESVWRGLFFFIGIFVSGAPMYAVMIYQTFLVLITGFTHANINLPVKLDKAISYIFVSPNMHKVHHHWKQPYTDSNYGAVFSIWDRLFGTFRTMNKSDIRYGLDQYYPDEKDEDFLYLMKKPFKKLKS